MNICICGGGSLGIVCAGVFLSQGHTVSILTGKPDKWRKDISVTDYNGKILSGRLHKVSSLPEEVIPGEDMVLLCLPGFMIENVLKDIKPYLTSNSLVGSIVSSTGFFFFAHDILPPIIPIFGFQRVPYIARVKEYGCSGVLLGYKNSLNVAVENHPDPEEIRFTLERLFQTPVSLLESFYEAALTNSNPILHTGRLYSLWKDYSDESVANPVLFYSGWTDEASDIIIKMDNEFFNVLNALGVREGALPSLLEYYESSDSESLTNKIKSIPAFKSIQAPMKETAEGLVPDFGSRYFTEDFPFGLFFIKKLARANNIATPTIDMVYEWGMSMLGVQEKDMK